VSPTWYDILGVRPDASADEIKRAWRDAADRFEPGSGGGAQFRLFNEAAEVLLDPARRREYDAGLEARPEPPPVAEPTPSVAEPTAVAEPIPAVSEPTSASSPAEAPLASSGPTGEAAAPRPLPLWLVGALLLVALVLVVVDAVYGVPKWQSVREADAVDQTRRTAPAAADRAAKVILSYSYTSLAADESAAVRYMTSGYAAKYRNTYDRLVKPNATKLKAKVVAQVRDTAVTNASSDRASILVYVNQTTRSTANNAPQVALNRVSFAMVRQNGVWLVDDITSY
jgi:Mce-associated membrane protein